MIMEYRTIFLIVKRIFVYKVLHEIARTLMPYEVQESSVRICSNPRIRIISGIMNEDEVVSAESRSMTQIHRLKHPDITNLTIS